jgi:hypothetical protein
MTPPFSICARPLFTVKLADLSAFLRVGIPMAGLPVAVAVEVHVVSVLAKTTYCDKRKTDTVF